MAEACSEIETSSSSDWTKISDSKSASSSHLISEAADFSTFSTISLAIRDSSWDSAWGTVSSESMLTSEEILSSALVSVWLTVSTAGSTEAKFKTNASAEIFGGSKIWNYILKH